LSDHALQNHNAILALDPPEKEGPGIHCLRMRLISQKSWENRGIYSQQLMTAHLHINLCLQNELLRVIE